MNRARYRKRPVEVEAWRVPTEDVSVDEPDGVSEWNDLAKWCGGFIGGVPGDHYITIETLEGPMRALSGDWIIQGTQGEFYPCKNAAFEDTYEPVTENEEVAS